ncbi:uncharacterized protein LOC111879398 isoform X2 [Lactuca sativa]|uniref:uncharacterized protein LOC111879398 isoform X2 n=1 Tax=Lactuca sativa TaxID=4236 RepID=UPI000CD92FEA|nr:uncharacterized protein LOC111879398 isoform X2 [Lactuca sativa]
MTSANMDSDLHSPVDSGGAKAAFHKPSNDSSNRKYRRRSPVSGSSSSDVEPTRDRSSTPTHSLQRKDDNRDYKRSRYSSSNSNRHSDRRSYNDRRHDDHKRRDKYADEDQKSFHKGCYSDKYSRDRSDGSGHRGRDRDKRDEKRDYPRTSKGGKSESLPTFEESRGHRSGHHNHHKDTSWRDSKELDDTKYGGRFEKGKSYNQEGRELKDRHFKEPKELVDDKTVLAARKSKFSMDKDPEFSKDGSKHVGVANEVQSSSSKQGQEFVGKATVEQEFVKDSDIDAAKIAAMKAAELVNRNLIGTGIMSTDQKKKLLWGSKKSTATEESGHKWDTSMFSDRERQEKFKKLMSLRLYWYIWPIVGCKSGPQSGCSGCHSCREAERASDGLGETVHCWPSSQRWPYCWLRPLIFFYLLYMFLLPPPPHHASFKLCVPFQTMILIGSNHNSYLMLLLSGKKVKNVTSTFEIMILLWT